MNRSHLLGALVCALVLSWTLTAAALSPAEVYRASSPSVVVIFGIDGAGGGSAGTGSIITDQGLILTNNHVIYDAKSRGPFPKLTVYFKPERITGDTKRDLRRGMRARVVARDAALDLALIKVDGLPANAEVISFGNSEATQIGTPVAAIGHPGGGGLWTLTTGTISSTRSDGKRQVFQTDTAINPGNSGGPLLDANASLIGVNTYVKRVNAQGLPLEGLNYSLRSSLARRWLEGLGVDVETAAVPAAAAEAPPAQAAPARASHATAGAERAYRTRNGESAYGVPDYDFDLDATLDEVIERSQKNARDAFDELDDATGARDDDFDLDDF